MKKLSFLMISLLAMTLFTACNKDDDDRITKQSFSMVTNTRAFIYANGNEAFFSQGTTKGEIDYTHMMFTFTADYKDPSGIPHTIALPSMKLESKTGNIYTFQVFDSEQSFEGEYLAGGIDFATGMLWYTFSVDGITYVSTSNLLYAYTVTKVTNPDNGNHFDHEQSAYLFAPDAKGQTCTMQISNFIPNISGAVELSEIKYEGLTLIPAIDGYVISGTDLEPTNFKGHHIITDLQILLNTQCTTINGSFKCNGLEFKLNGELLPGAFNN